VIHPLSGHAYGLRIYAVLLATSYAIVPAVGSPPKTGTMQLQRFDQFGDPLPEGASARMGTTRFRAGASMNDVTYSRDGKRIITSAIDQIDVWETGSGKLLRHFAGFSVRRKDVPIEVGYPFAISPDQNHVAAGGADGRIRIYQLGSAKSLIEWETPGAKEFFGRRPAIRSLVYSPDGRTLLTVEHTGMVRLWSVGSGAELRVFSEPKAGVLAIAFSPDGKLIAYAHTDKSIRLCAVESGKEVIRCAGHPDFARVLRFSPGGKIIASALFEYTHSKEKDDSVRLWDVVTGKELQRLHGNDRGTPLAFSPDGTSLATSADGSVRIWDPAAGTERLHFRAHSQGILKGIRALEFSPDGKRLVSCGIDQTVHEWDAATGKEIEPMG
jgi:WD40 repeat protein